MKKYIKKFDNATQYYIFLGIIIIILYVFFSGCITDKNKINGQDIDKYSNISNSTKDFLEEPIVKIKVLNNIINKSSDGIVEIYLNNPSINNQSLNVRLYIYCPYGLIVYGKGIYEAISSGIPYAKYEIFPGNISGIYIYFKSEKAENFSVRINGFYWPDDNKDFFRSIDWAINLIAEEPSPESDNEEPTDPHQLDYLLNKTVI